MESIFGKGSLFKILLTFPIAQEFARTELKSLPINPESAPINELNRLVRSYRLQEALAMLDKEFKDVIGTTQEITGD